MKTKITVLALLFTFLGFAQNGINYKAVIKDNTGNVVANDLIQIQFTILQGTTIVFQETHTPTTDANGIVILNIGEGTPTPISGVFQEINWGNDDHFLNVKVNNGDGLIDIGTTEFKTVPYAINAINATNTANVTGLEAINEGYGIGWRLKGRNPDYYGYIGRDAVDLSVNSEVSTKGATGAYCFASGFGTESSGNSTTAMGKNTKATGNYSTAMGSETIATGFASTALGWSTQATAAYSTALGRETVASGTSGIAMGLETVASGTNSIAMGRLTVASGSNSIAVGYSSKTLGNQTTAMGYFTKAEALFSTAIGKYNIGGGNRTADNQLDPIFEVGNGTSDAARSNALTVLKNGNIGIGIAHPTAKLQLNGRIQFGNYEYIQDGGAFLVEVNGGLISIEDGLDDLGSSSFRWRNVFATNGVINTSDRRDKTNIVNIPYGLKDLMKLKPVSFNWKDHANDDRKLGLVAQEVLEIIPEVVKTHENVIIDENDRSKTKSVAMNRMGVYYSDLIPVLIKAIQEQQEVIEIQNKVNDLQKEEIKLVKENYQSLLSRIEALERKTSN